MSGPFKLKGWSPFTQQEHEGSETMSGEQLRDEWGESTKGGTDYYVKRTKAGDPIILGEVGLGKPGTKKEVVGVPGRKGGKLTRRGDKPE